jgi:hypothetical protein
MEENIGERYMETGKQIDCDMVCTRAAWGLLTRFMTFDIEQRGEKD